MDQVAGESNRLIGRAVRCHPSSVRALLARSGGAIIRLRTGDLLHLRFRARRIDLLDPAAVREGRVALAGPGLLGTRDEFFAKRLL